MNTPSTTLGHLVGHGLECHQQLLAIEIEGDFDRSWLSFVGRFAALDGAGQ